MSVAPPKLEYDPESLLAYMFKRGSSLEWGNVNVLNEGAFREKGFVGAYNEAIHPNSERLASSGMSNTMSRKNRKEHYRRKAILETRKAKERRDRWERRNPARIEANWKRLEEIRNERKARERAFRRTKKAAKRSSSKHH